MVARFATALRVSSDEILGLSKEDELSSTLSLRFVKRLSVIETFPEAQKKRILRNLDDAIAASKKDGSSSQNSESQETTTSSFPSRG